MASSNAGCKHICTVGLSGVSWCNKETLELMALWGDRRVQEALRSSHRNVDKFKAIAHDMAPRGCKRTAVEYQNKSKALAWNRRSSCATMNVLETDQQGFSSSTSCVGSYVGMPVSSPEELHAAWISGDKFPPQMKSAPLKPIAQSLFLRTGAQWTCKTCKVKIWINHWLSLQSSLLSIVLDTYKIIKTGTNFKEKMCFSPVCLNRYW